MSISLIRTGRLWLLWTVLSVGLAVWFGYILFGGEDKTVFMPGPLNDGHHQLEQNCEVCHTDPLGGGDVLQDACIRCHQAEHKKPFDSHPLSKFRDPRNADTLENIDALHCVTCHVEHKPEITRKDGLTQPEDFCIHCHAEIGEERDTHRGMDFMTCKDSGCHNFHNNRDIYTDFLLKHLHEPDLLAEPVLPEKDLRSSLEEIMEYPHADYPLEKLSGADMDYPQGMTFSGEIKADWAATAHAGSGVNCSACHVVPLEDGLKPVWQDSPGQQACGKCHDLEKKRLEKGRHGMRLAVGLSPMTPGQARLPMNEGVMHAELDCMSCHGAHRFDVQQAAVESCLQCHADDHSRAYKDSPHYGLWQREVAGDLPAGRGVSCASCHMPRVSFDVNDWVSRTGVDHNQSANLSPNSKMLRSSCLHCHGMQFSLDALADDKLINNNFLGRPQVHVKSLELAEEDYERAMAERRNAE